MHASLVGKWCGTLAAQREQAAATKASTIQPAAGSARRLFVEPIGHCKEERDATPGRSVAEQLSPGVRRQRDLLPGDDRDAGRCVGHRAERVVAEIRVELDAPTLASDCERSRSGPWAAAGRPLKVSGRTIVGRSHLRQATTASSNREAHGAHLETRCKSMARHSLLGWSRPPRLAKGVRLDESRSSCT